MSFGYILNSRGLDSRGQPRVARPSYNGGGRALTQIASRPPPSSALLPLDVEVDREYGGRFLPNYTKQRLLGKGACGAVWLASSTLHSGTVAVKQVLKGSDTKSRADERAANAEIAIAALLFDDSGAPRVSCQNYPGIRHITRLLDAFETKQDLWLVMEFGGDPLSKALFDIKGEFVSRGAAQPRERVYRVHHLQYYQRLKLEQSMMKVFLAQLFEAVLVLSDHGIVHADLKPDNILLEWVGGKPRLRICDFGSAFMSNRPEHLALATPEYMPPEALSNHANGQASVSTQPWSFDMWSLGAILLELAYGVPHWLSYKCRVRGFDGKRDHSLSGLFAVPSRDHDRILQRQMDVTAEDSLLRTLKDAPGVPLGENGLDLLAAMLQRDPLSRISPLEALGHPYLDP